ncbi:MAG: DUF885 domain-containing protein, partial [Gammaproteobacteria bacterium]
MSISTDRRSVIAALAATAATAPLWSATGTPPVPSAADKAALKLLDEAARNLLQLFPETATSLGVDRGADARLRSKLGDRSAAGQRAIAARLRRDLDKVAAIDTAALS